MPPPLPPADLDEVLATTRPLWDDLRGERLFLSGGTGFFGCWLVETFLHANRLLHLNAHLTLLTRDPAAFRSKLPHLQDHPALTLLAGDVRTFTPPPGVFPFILHAATEASARLLAENPAQMHSTILAGTARVLEFAASANTARLLFTSSGAVYGPQPPQLTHIPEDFIPAPQSLYVYAEGKRQAEALCLAAAGPSLQVSIARCFAFLGPHLPLDQHFAIGNFLADALAHRPIHIASDGSSIRSYLYASDLAIWLWTMLFRAPSGRAYNVGSEDALTILETAEAVTHAVDPGLPILVAQQARPGTQPHRYVPSTAQARTELGLTQRVSLHDALCRTAAWQRLKSTQA